jgi:Carboxypeptidase regulatory-like domain
MYACGANPTAPTPPPTPYTLSGVVTATLAGTRVGGASISLRTETLQGGVSSWTGTASTDGNGAFAFSSVPSGILDLTITCGGCVTRESKVSVTGSMSNLQLDVILNQAPFSLDFYRQFARDGFESSLHNIAPWTMSPSIYVQTVTPDTGDPVPGVILNGVQRVFVNSLADLTGGRMHVQAYMQGTEPRDLQTGWIVVMFYRSRSVFVGEGANGTVIDGDSLVQSNIGRIRLLYDPVADSQGLFNPMACESLTVAVADHEIVHAMGFWHTSDTFDDFHSGVGCPGSGRPDRVKFHAAVMYSRPPANRDLDQDTVVFYPAPLATLNGLIGDTDRRVRSIGGETVR